MKGMKSAELQKYKKASTVYFLPSINGVLSETSALDAKMNAQIMRSPPIALTQCRCSRWYVI